MTNLVGFNLVFYVIFCCIFEITVSFSEFFSRELVLHGVLGFEFSLQIY